MSSHFSRHALNTYAWTDYFREVVPADYPLSAVLQRSRAFRRLPPRLRRAAGLAKRWAVSTGFDTSDIDQWYDLAGNELDPDSGRRLTDEEIDAQWAGHSTAGLSQVVDIPEPPGGFPDPVSWRPTSDLPTPDLPEEDQLAVEVAYRGTAAVEEEYGITLSPEPPDEEVIATGELYKKPKG